MEMEDWGEFVKSPNAEMNGPDYSSQINGPDESNDWGDFVESPLPLYNYNNNTDLTAKIHNHFNFSLFGAKNNDNISDFAKKSDFKSGKNGDLSPNSEKFAKKSDFDFQNLNNGDFSGLSSNFNLFGAKTDNNNKNSGLSSNSDLCGEKSELKSSNFDLFGTNIDINVKNSGLSSDSNLFGEKVELKSSKSDLFAEKSELKSLNFDLFAPEIDIDNNSPKSYFQSVKNGDLSGFSSKSDFFGEKSDFQNLFENKSDFQNMGNGNLSALSSNSDLFSEKSELKSSNSDLFAKKRELGNIQNGNLSGLSSNFDIFGAKNDNHNLHIKNNSGLSSNSENSDLFGEKSDFHNLGNGNLSSNINERDSNGNDLNFNLFAKSNDFRSSNSDLFDEKSDLGKVQNENLSGLSSNSDLFDEKSDLGKVQNENLSGLSSNSDLFDEKSDLGKVQNENLSALNSNFGLFGEKSNFRSFSNGDLSGFGSNSDLFSESKDFRNLENGNISGLSSNSVLFGEKSDFRSFSNGDLSGLNSNVDMFSVNNHSPEMKDTNVSDVFSEQKLENGNDDDDSNEWFGNFQGASTGNELKEEGNETKNNIYNGALPLALFGDEELETDDSSNAQDDFAYKPSFTRRDGANSQGSSYPINVLISDLYSQAQQYPSVENPEKLAGNGLNLNPSDEVFSHIPENCDVNSDDDSWEFKDASAGTCSLELSTHLVFYRKLEEELSFVCRFHLHNLKEARDSAVFCGEDEKVRVIEQEIQEACKELEEDNSNFEILSENQKLREISLDGFLKVLDEPKFKVLESRYQLSRKLHLAQKDLASAIEAMKHTKSKLNILKIGSSEDQFNYVSTWCRIINVCAQELKHGSWIWKQTIGNNLQDCIISEPRGKDFILSLGEIYKVVIILGASAKLYEPWILSNTSTFRGIFSLLEDCCTLWSSLRIEEALEALPVNNGHQSTAKALLKSIKHIQEFDDLILRDLVFNQQVPMCRLSLLSSEVIPDMKMLTWNGETYFVTLANLWVNLISCDLPILPHLQVSS